MAGRPQPVSALPGTLAAALVAALILGTLAAVFGIAGGGGGFSPADWAALRFTVVQAGLSAVLSVVLAIPVARALARRRFRGRRVLILLLGAPFILPVIVAIMGLLQVFGRSGWVNAALGVLGLPGVQIYGLHGVVLAHVFFNLPLAARLILQGWQEVPAERFRLAAQLGCGAWAMVRLIELPVLARVVPGALAVIFAICLTSFAVALTLGGGPGATTLELAIYQAFRYDFDPGRAAWLAVLQLALTGGAVALALPWFPDRIAGSGTVAPGMEGQTLDRPVERWDGGTKAARTVDAAAISLAAGFLLLPLLAVVLRGAAAVAALPAAVFAAAGVSVAVALASTALVLILALPMAVTIATRGGVAVELVGVLGLAASPMVIGAGLFIVIHPLVDPAVLALPVTAAVNAAMALPFCLRILVPATRQVIGQYGRLGMSLGMGGGAFFRRVLIPRLRPQIGFTAGLTAALSMGDLGVIALFADADMATLPLQIYRLMGAYRMDAAAAAALLLLVLSVGMFWAFDRGGRWHGSA